jgi:hypothetical protein
MMRLARRSSLIVLFFLVTVSTASAECAWVLWGTHLPGADWTRHAAYATEDSCWAKITSITFVPREGSSSDQFGWLLHQISPEISAYGRWMLWRRPNGVEMETFGYKCLPDTWDPRGPKTK